MCNIAQLKSHLMHIFLSLQLIFLIQFSVILISLKISTSLLQHSYRTTTSLPSFQSPPQHSAYDVP